MNNEYFGYMKKFFLLLIGAGMFCTAGAQVVEQGEAAVVYYSPKTAIHVDFTYTEEKQEAGIYAQYAEEMIGAENAIKTTKTTYSIKDVRVGTSTATDYTRPHKVAAEPGVPMLLTINERGLLTGYNLPAEKKEAQSRPNEQAKVRGAHKHPETGVAPLPEEVLKAATPLAQAHAVARQIFHLRETRMYLINGEVEHAPADGEAMRLVLEELDKQERQLTELFTGKRSKRTLHKKVRMNEGETEKVLFFSDENGFTSAENVEADSVKISIAIRPQTYAPAKEEKKKKKGSELSQIVYNLPGKGIVSVRYKNETLAHRTVPMAQYGIDVPLTKEFFTGKELPVIVFSEKTGNIVSISK